ncbi:DEAD/DEAH box helicase [Actinomycetospora sp. TBRC 11914]|uniref:DEAD/DEAH box helicase n=1 Tax=Actinomycetospora sp. TBRC 11914 TaxID=2729387 RepID=UPI00145E56A2|nr:DEAD/DEAH box helicase [Actinomycetospora sp. TBRC 11914]NMO91430.1 DEAD/DEAH box helicase [Actinomycetospora sp. TBRC 11914]
MTDAAVLSDPDLPLDPFLPDDPEADSADDAEAPEADAHDDASDDAAPDEADDEPTNGFAPLGLDERVLATLVEQGFHTPTPIQTETIPLLLAGRDVLGLAQTGTGKTAAFALPLLSRIDPAVRAPQALILTPTRELAIQVAEAIESFSAGLSHVHVVQLYGGAPYGPQLSALRRGAQIVVGTPGRVADHLEKGTLDLTDVGYFVLDEADEMLQMGFLDEVEHIFGLLPADRQVALFSATMPAAIREVSRKHLNAPEEVSIKGKTTTVANTRQRYVVLPERLKADALARVLQVEDFDAALVFVRTRQNTTDVTDALNRRGFAAVAISGDLSQAQREKTIADLRSGKIDVLVATDVAARGLDVERISLVVNHDLPTDPESYVHRIGRTGRAGRSGDAISFVTRGQIRLLRAIENTTRQKAEEMSVPGTDEVNDRRRARFAERITAALEGTDDGGDPLAVFRKVVDDYVAEHDVDPLALAAALAKMVQGGKPLLVEDLPAPPPRGEKRPRDDKPGRGQGKRPAAPSWTVGSGTDTYRIEVGHNQRVKPGAIVGAIANEAGLDSAHIGHIDIRPDHTLVELPADVPGPVVKRLQRARVAGRPMGLRRASEAPSSGPRPDKRGRDRGGRPERRERAPR